MFQTSKLISVKDENQWFCFTLILSLNLGPFISLVETPDVHVI